MTWNSNNTSNWNTATLNTYLNGTYYNSLSNKNLIDTATWYLGGPLSTDYSNPNNFENLTSSGWYNIEKSNNVYSGNLTSVTSNIALIYPSDYGFSTNYDVGAGAATPSDPDTYGAGCLSKDIAHYNGYCARGSWMFDDNNGYMEWLLSPLSDNSDINRAVRINKSHGFIDHVYVNNTLFVRPALYLKSTAQITGGAGTSSNPYTLSV